MCFFYVSGRFISPVGDGEAIDIFLFLLRLLVVSDQSSHRCSPGRRSPGAARLSLASQSPLAGSRHGIKDAADQAMTRHLAVLTNHAKTLKAVRNSSWMTDRHGCNTTIRTYCARGRGRRRMEARLRRRPSPTEACGAMKENRLENSTPPLPDLGT